MFKRMKLHNLLLLTWPLAVLSAGACHWVQVGFLTGTHMDALDNAIHAVSPFVLMIVISAVLSALFGGLYAARAEGVSVSNPTPEERFLIDSYSALFGLVFLVGGFAYLAFLFGGWWYVALAPTAILIACLVNRDVLDNLPEREEEAELFQPPHRTKVL